MTRANWAGKLAAIVGVALVAAVGAAALPDNPYQRWQLIENTLYANATWSYERIHYDPRPIDVAILGASRSQMGLSAPAVAARLAALGTPLTVANLSVIEDGRNLEWAIADELFKAKRPRLVVLMINETVHPWGHPGFKYVAPVATVVEPRAWLLHNVKDDLPYLPYRQLLLLGASIAPGVFGLRDAFDAERYAAKPDDYSVSRLLPDGKWIDMDRDVPAADLAAEARAFAETRGESQVPASIGRVTEADDHVYVTAIARLAARHGARLIFVFLPVFDGATTIEDRAFYAALGPIADDGALAADPHLYQSFSHLNRRGALIASDRLAGVIAATVRDGVPAAREVTG